jgi:hypothetical protein
VKNGSSRAVYPPVWFAPFAPHQLRDRPTHSRSVWPIAGDTAKQRRMPIGMLVQHVEFISGWRVMIASLVSAVMPYPGKTRPRALKRNIPQHAVSQGRTKQGVFMLRAVAECCAWTRSCCGQVLKTASDVAVQSRKCCALLRIWPGVNTGAISDTLRANKVDRPF